MRPDGAAVSWQRVTVVGVTAAGLILAVGLGAERVRFGADASVTGVRLADEVRRELGSAAADLADVAGTLASESRVPSALAAGPAGARTLFTILNSVDSRSQPERAVTLYDSSNEARAWVGRPSAVPPLRLTGGPALFVTPGPLGLRLIRIEPVLEPAEARRVGTIAVEAVLSAPTGIGLTDEADYIWSTSLVDVDLVPRYVLPSGGGTTTSPVLFDTAGTPLLGVRIDEAEIASARRGVRGRILGAAGVISIATLVLLGAPLDRWRRRSTATRFALGTVGLCLLLLGVRWLLWIALPAPWRPAFPFDGGPAAGWFAYLFLRSPVDLLSHGLLALALVGVCAVGIDPLRFACRRRCSSWPALRSDAVAIAAHVVAGILAATVAFAFSRLVDRIVEQSSLDVLQLSLHPYDGPRLALLIALVSSHAAALWGATLLLLLAAAVSPWRRARPGRLVLLVASCLLPAFVLAVNQGDSLADALRTPWLITVCSAVVGAGLWGRVSAWFRHSSRAGRVVVVTLAFVAPSILLYPMLVDAADRSLQQRIELQFAGETLSLPRTLLARLDEARLQIDRIEGLTDFLAASSTGSDPATEVAFSIWRRTALAAWRLTSAVEIYDATGHLVSRFALNLPEYEPRAQQYRVASCRWGVFGEATPFGAEERRMLHAERGLCDQRGTVVGGVVVHVLLDYATLSFISSQSPYFEVLRGRQDRAREETTAREVSLTIYGWGRTAVYTTTGRAWPLSDDLFNRIYRSNQGFWTELEDASQRSAVYVISDRNGIYALAYPQSTWFDASVRIAELATLGAVVACFVLLGSSVLQWLAGSGRFTGSELLRELRTSFSRKLFLSFVAATVIPVLILAVAIRAFVALRLRHDIEAEATRTAAVAQRVIEETLSLERRAELAASALDDDALVLISRIIGQDVNIYEGSRLVATSERDLFASGQLTARTPEAVYQALVIDRLPTFIGEDDLAGLPYLMAAAPVRSGGREAILTVPFTLRQREIEREIDELDRGVQLGAVVFILFGAAIGYWLAERISDPVQRLTRASRRIAGGDLDTRVFVRSVDELRRLVEAFNRMAWELQRQRTQLERTNRLEAWADMARQVAHDIKNPLTPIQLSAEHLRRVHQDRGEPLSPILESCIETILGQVRLLRQIASEFSSFASTPVPHPISTDLGDLLREIVAAYVTGLSGRVEFAVNVASDVPRVYVDRSLIGRALTNIVENALHAMPSGGRIAIDVHPAPAGSGSVVLSIVDTGIGMDEEALARLFEPYFSTKASGTGLGLTIAKRNIELHGGSIDITSRKGAGTRVIVTLPAGSSAARHGQEPASS
ncbi:MAG: ATP-binding protein [Vicinamibacterales bacterium]